MQDDVWVPLGNEGQGENRIGQLLELDVRLTALPRKWIHTPTCRPRKTDVQGRHIDVVGGKNGVFEGRGVIVGSYLYIGSDHEVVVQELQTVETRRRLRRPNTRPKRVVGEIAVPEAITQESLKTMAEKFTKPYGKTAYADPEHVKVFFRIATRSVEESTPGKARGSKQVERRANQSSDGGRLASLSKTCKKGGLWMGRSLRREDYRTTRGPP